MKIAIIDMDDLKNPFWAAGAARATREVGKRLAKKHEVTVYCSKYPGFRDYKEDGIRYIHKGINFPNARFANISFIATIPFLVRKINADLILENFHAPTSVSFSPIFTKTPVVALPAMFNAGEFAKKYHLPFHWIEKFGMRFYKYMLPYSKTDSVKAKKLNPGIIYKIVPQGVGDEYLKIRLKEPKYILFLGRFDIMQKGIDLMLKSYNQVKEEIGLPLIIAGHGPDGKKIKKLIKDLNLTDYVSLVGSAYGKKKIDLISHAAFVAFPSRHDEMSIWSLEALASGLPLVVFNLPEHKWISPEVSLRAKAFSIKQFSEALLKLSKDKKLLEQKRKNSKSFVRKFTWEKVAKYFEIFFNEVLKKERTYINEKS